MFSEKITPFRGSNYLYPKTAAVVELNGHRVSINGMVTTVFGEHRRTVRKVARMLRPFDGDGDVLFAGGHKSKAAAEWLAERYEGVKVVETNAMKVSPELVAEHARLLEVHN